ncbi:tctex1 domain-containing protein 2-like [Carassius auratus]|uniref:Tctex1 domain-containing protein 2-like n=1 Tax=Carassius auratus TaxID=7957 RepID=A0A6P6M393_CARAU|nr:tctex1 domain-containing protein 2-like [Carassius auratus]
MKPSCYGNDGQGQQTGVFSDVGFDRYKLIVQVVVGEQRGEGVKQASPTLNTVCGNLRKLFFTQYVFTGCFWVADTDSYARDIFMNDSLFCVTAAFGVYLFCNLRTGMSWISVTIDEI